jgi:steroid 5-alpha reductase family enzyme
MTQLKSMVGIVVSLVIACLIIVAGSHGSINIDNISLFALCGAIGFILHWTVFIPSFAFRTEHYFDLTGSLSYITTTVVALVLNPTLDIRDLVICAMIIIWAARLGSFLFRRIKKDGQDKRFIVMKTKFTWFLMTWTIGGLWVLVTMAAGLAALTSNTAIEFGLIGYFGITLWIFGFMVEVIADKQKTTFRKNPENKDKFITTGIWSWSQHPNYFGEITLWSGLALVALPALSGWQLVTMISPLFVYLLLTRISGIPLLDRLADKKWGDNPDYKSYVAATSKLLLKPPKNLG